MMMERGKEVKVHRGKLLDISITSLLLIFYTAVPITLRFFIGIDTRRTQKLNEFGQDEGQRFSITFPSDSEMTHNDSNNDSLFLMSFLSRGLVQGTAEEWVYIISICLSWLLMAVGGIILYIFWRGQNQRIRVGTNGGLNSLSTVIWAGACVVLGCAFLLVAETAATIQQAGFGLKSLFVVDIICVAMVAWIGITVTKFVADVAAIHDNQVKKLQNLECEREIHDDDDDINEDNCDEVGRRATNRPIDMQTEHGHEGG